MTIGTGGDGLRVLLVAVVAVLGVTRATQMVLHDRILRAPRAALLRRWNPRGLPPGHDDLSYPAYLLTCPWCVSTWLGLLTVSLLAWDYTRPATVWVLGALSLSIGAVVIDRLIDRHVSDEDAAARLAVTVEVPSAVEEAFAAGTDAASEER